MEAEENAMGNPPAGGGCAVCGGRFLWDKLKRCGAGEVCGDCLAEYRAGKETIGQYSPGFLKYQEPNFHWWLFTGDVYLNPMEKLDWLRTGWKDWKGIHPQEAKEAGEEFIRCSPGEWEEYLSQR